MEKDLDPVIEFYGWDLATQVGNTRSGHVITVFVNTIIKLESYRLHEERDDTRVFAVSIQGRSNYYYYITSETYDRIRERMHIGTPIKIEEVVCVERV